MRANFLISLLFALLLAASLHASPNQVSLFHENGKVGLKDRDGQVLIPARYEAIGWSNGKLSVIDKIVGYKINGLWGLIQTTDKVVTRAEYNELYAAEGSLIIAQKRSSLSQRPSYGLLNSSGKMILPFQYDGMKVTGMRAIVMSRSSNRFLFGMLDLSDRIVIPLAYKNIQPLGSLRYAVENFENKTAIFSEEGMALTPFDIDSLSNFRKDLAVVYRNEFQGVIDRSGKMILPVTYAEVRIGDDGSVEVREPHNWSIIDGKNAIKEEAHVDEIIPVSRSVYSVRSVPGIRLVDAKMSPLHDGFFSHIGKFENDRAVFRHRGKSGVISSGGKIIVPPNYTNIIPVGDAYIASTDPTHKKWILLNENAEHITEKTFESIKPFNGKFFPVRSRGFWGGVDRNGKQIINCVHDEIVQVYDDLVAVKFKGEYGVIDLNENWIVTPQRNKIRILNDSNYFVYDGAKTFLKSTPNNLIYFSDNVLEYDNGLITEYQSSGGIWKVSLGGVIVERSEYSHDSEEVYPFHDGLRLIKKDGKYGFIDEGGRLRVANRYDAARPFADGLSAIRIGERWGFIDREEEIIVQPVYDSVQDFIRGTAVVQRNGFFGMIDQRGHVIMPVRYEEILYNAHQRFVVRQQGFFGLADDRGNILIQPRYDRILDTGNGYVIVSRDSKWGLVTLRGVSTIPMIYDEIRYDAHRDQYLAFKRSAWKKILGHASGMTQH